MPFAEPDNHVNFRLWLKLQDLTAVFADKSCFLSVPYTGYLCFFGQYY